MREQERHAATTRVPHDAEGTRRRHVELPLLQCAHHDAEVVEFLGVRVRREALDAREVTRRVHARAAHRDGDGNEAGAGAAAGAASAGSTFSVWADAPPAPINSADATSRDRQREVMEMDMGLPYLGWAPTRA